jgi:uncharacterized membrane protein YfcA
VELPVDLAAWLAVNPTAAWVCLALVGLVAGVANTMAGGGGFVMLPALIAMGLPPSTANGTLRVAVVTQNLASIATFHARGERPYPLAARLAVPMTIGAIGGAFLATRLDDSLLRSLFGALLLVWGVALVFDPKRFTEPAPQPRPVSATTIAGALAIGIYGGFVQAGVGFPLLALLAGHLGLALVKANAIKVIVVAAFTAVALPVFALAGQVDWVQAAVLAIGTTAGGWLGARWQLESGPTVVRWFLVVMLALSGAMMLMR